MRTLVVDDWATWRIKSTLSVRFERLGERRGRAVSVRSRSSLCLTGRVSVETKAGVEGLAATRTEYSSQPCGTGLEYTSSIQLASRTTMATVLLLLYYTWLLVLGTESAGHT